MWRCGSAKQRVRLGPSRYFCCGFRRRYTDANAHGYADSDRDGNGNSNPYCHCHSIGHPHPATDVDSESRAISKAAPLASAKAVEFAYRKFRVHPSRGSSSIEEIAGRMLRLPLVVDTLLHGVHVHRAWLEQTGLGVQTGK